AAAMSNIQNWFAPPPVPLFQLQSYNSP
ncbi:hypothetical protein, partial [Sodalis-like endosymbiont of Proechinophthirus fluctus]